MADDVAPPPVALVGDPLRRGGRIDPMALTFGHGRNTEALRRLDLLVTRRLDGMLQGDYRGLVPGHGSELGETRAYQAGDDVRRIDWNVTARTQHAHVRETIADRELETWVLLDRSASLQFGTATYAKSELAAVALASIGFLTARTGNRFGAVLAPGPAGPDAPPMVIPARGGRTHLLSILHRAMEPVVVEPPRPIGPARRGSRRGAPAPVADTPTAGRTDLAAAIERLALVHRRRGLAVVISDFLAPAGWDLPLRHLTARHETLAVEIVDPRELELPAVGVLALVDPETGRRREIQTSSPKLRARYAEAAAAQRADIAAAIRGAGADHIQLRTDRDWLSDLVRFVALRRERAARLPRKAR